MPVASKWAQLIFKREKTVEGRKNNPNNWGRIKTGDILNIIDESTGKNMKFRVRDIRKYPNLQMYLEQEGLRNTLPGIQTFIEGENVYLKEVGWTIEEINKNGIIAIELDFFN